MHLYGILVKVIQIGRSFIRLASEQRTGLKRNNIPYIYIYITLTHTHLYDIILFYFPLFLPPRCEPRPFPASVRKSSSGPLSNLRHATSEILGFECECFILYSPHRVLYASVVVANDARDIRCVLSPCHTGRVRGTIDGATTTTDRMLGKKNLCAQESADSRIETCTQSRVVRRHFFEYVRCILL